MVFTESLLVKQALGLDKIAQWFNEEIVDGNGVEKNWHRLLAISMTTVSY